MPSDFPEIEPGARAPGVPRGRRPAQPDRGPWDWVTQPRSTVLLLLALIVGIGGLRRLREAWRARALVARLEEPDPAPSDLLLAGSLGRAALVPLFQILGHAESPALRDAAGRALACVWASDHLIGEEEQALVRRGFQVHWSTRRTYPRAIRRPIPIEVSYGIPFLEAEGPGIHPADLEWSHRVSGAGRAGLEIFSPWQPGPIRFTFTIEPTDFLSNGPHRLILQTRVRTSNQLTSSWQIELPHVALSLEFDPRLELSALLTVPDASRAEAITSLISLGDAPETPSGPSLIDLGRDLVLTNPPVLKLAGPLPVDLAHRAEVEFEGVEGRFPAGEVVVCSGSEAVPGIPIAPIGLLPAGSIDHPGPRRMRCLLTPDPELGWSHPGVRSIWPERLETSWHTVQVMRR